VLPGHALRWSDPQFNVAFNYDSHFTNPLDLEALERDAHD